MSKYAVNIGLEVHIQLNTLSKAFCADSTQFGQPANSQVSAVSLAYPGTLPRINSEHITKAVTLALALNCTINEYNYFDRKSYFYPDLPKGYQITQDNEPYCKGGYLDVSVGGQTKRIAIHHIHMEEDAGKSIHTLDKANTFIDLNRAGTPLLELVTEPTITSAEEAYAFLTQLRALVRYLGISDGNMEEGSMRADCNVSIRLQGAEQMGERREVKNVNSLKFAKKAIEYEIKKQTSIVDQGGTIIQSTMDYDPDKNITIPLREKEDAHDYRYFPDPDLPPLHLSSSFVAEIKQKMPPNPEKVIEKLSKQYRISLEQASIFTYDLFLRRHFERIADSYFKYDKLANFFTNKLIPLVQQESKASDNLPISDPQIISLLTLIDDKKVSASIAFQKILPELVEGSGLAIDIAQKMDLIIAEGNSDDLEKVFLQILKDNPDKVTAYKKGKKGLIGFFMGQAMKATGGKIDPKSANKILQRLLDIQ